MIKKLVFPTPITSRSNLFEAMIVEAGIVLQNTNGTCLAANYLKSQNISVDVAMRVLTDPKQRRKFKSRLL